MSEIIGTPRPTDRFTGVCETCQLPTARDLPAAVGDYTTTEPWLGSPRGCIQCGAPVRLQRVYGVLTGQPCHGACMGATGPDCECGCGGINHGAMLVVRDEMTADELAAHNRVVEKYRAEVARRAERAAARREAEAVAKRAVGESWRQANPELATWLAALDEPEGSFLADMARYAAADGLHERNTALCTRIMGERAERAAEQARRAEQEASAKPLPTGKGIGVTGEIVSLRWEDSPFGYGRSTCKILVVGDDGWKVWGTCPSALMDRELKGCRVTFTADVQAKEETFGYFSRPRKASHLAAECCDECSS
jgi:hypothetical protein